MSVTLLAPADEQERGRLTIAYHTGVKAFCQDPNCLCQPVGKKDRSMRVIRRGQIKVGSSRKLGGKTIWSWYHLDCRLQSVQQRVSNGKTIIIKKPSDLNDFENLQPHDRAYVAAEIEKYRDPDLVSFERKRAWALQPDTTDTYHDGTSKIMTSYQAEFAAFKEEQREIAQYWEHIETLKAQPDVLQYRVWNVFSYGVAIWKDAEAEALVEVGFLKHGETFYIRSADPEVKKEKQTYLKLADNRGWVAVYREASSFWLEVFPNETVLDHEMVVLEEKGAPCPVDRRTVSRRIGASRRMVCYNFNNVGGCTKDPCTMEHSCYFCGSGEHSASSGAPIECRAVFETKKKEDRQDYIALKERERVEAGEAPRNIQKRKRSELTGARYNQDEIFDDKACLPGALPLFDAQKRRVWPLNQRPLHKRDPNLHH